MVFVATAVFAASAFAVVGPDPAVVRFEFSINKDKFHPTRGTAHITAVVKNIGDAPYTTTPAQQNIQIFEQPLGRASAGPAKKVCTFGNLTVGQEVRCQYDRPWDSSSPGEGEFPPNYKAMIVYDPDIGLDGNPKNDDKNAKNNSLTASGSAINDRFHGH
jgi:hypothetical protein